MNASGAGAAWLGQTSGSATSQIPSPVPNKLSDMTDMIRVKERELHQFQDMRNAQLEALINEREKLLLDTKQKFELLKDDFQYNLKLIEARDKEIERLEQLIVAREKRVEELEQKAKALQARLEDMQIKEVERQEKAEQDKLMQKRVLDELRNVIEAMKWSADEELKTKAFEIENLKAELASLQRSKEEALEAQRRDLTGTFENIIHKREEAFKQKEIEIARQIGLLDQKFERLQSENTRLKADGRESKLTSERLLADMSSRELRIRQLTEASEDAAQAHTLAVDTLQRQIQALQSEMQRLLDTHHTEIVHLEQQLERHKQEANRERDFRAMVEQQLASSQAAAAEEVASLRDSLSSLAQQHGITQQELESTKMERDQALQRLASKRVELDSLQVVRDQYEQDMKALQSRAQRLEKDWQDVSDRYACLQQEHLSLRVTLEKRYEALAAQAQEDRAAALQSRAEALAQIESRHREEREDLQQRIADLKTQLDRSALSLEDRALESESSARRTQHEKDDLVKQLAEERTESDALRLRLKAQEQQLLSLQQELRHARSDGSGTGGGPGTGTGRLLASTGEITLGELSMDPPSPMMSEDLQALTWSPALRGYPPGPRMTSTPRMSSSMPPPPPPSVPLSFPVSSQQVGTGQTNFVMPSHAATAPAYPPQPPAPIASWPSDTHMDSLVTENEQLKKLIRDMRHDIEQVKARSPSPAPAVDRKSPAEAKQQAAEEEVKGEASAAANGARMEELLQALETSNKEIAKLRKERKKQMDISNELRAALYRLEDRREAASEQRLEEVRQQNVETIADWMQAPSGQGPPGRLGSSRRTTAPPAAVVSRNVWDPVPSPHYSSVGGYNSGGEMGPEAAMSYRGDSPPYMREPNGGMEVAGRAVPHVASQPFVRIPSMASRPASSLPLGNTERATRSQAESLQRLKERRAAQAAASAQPTAHRKRVVVNYALQAAAEAANMSGR